jgi:hypothetical protein
VAAGDGDFVTPGGQQAGQEEEKQGRKTFHGDQRN